MLFAIVLVFFGLKQYQLQAKKNIVILDKLLIHMEEVRFLLLTSPDLVFNHNCGSSNDVSLVLSSLKRLYFNGHEPLKPIHTLVRHLSSARLWANKKMQLQGILVGRILLIVCVMSFVRWLFGANYPENYLLMRELMFDVKAVAASFLLVALILWFFNSCYPSHWFWDLEFSEKGKYWLAAKFRLDVVGESDFAEKWSELLKKERLLGVDLQEEKEQYLDYWSMQQDVDMFNARDKFEDSLPFLEFLSFCFYTLFLLYSPLKQYLSSSFIGTF